MSSTHPSIIPSDSAVSDVVAICVECGRAWPADFTHCIKICCNGQVRQLAAPVSEARYGEMLMSGRWRDLKLKAVKR